MRDARCAARDRGQQEGCAAWAPAEPSRGKDACEMARGGASRSCVGGSGAVQCSPEDSVGLARWSRVLRTKGDARLAESGRPRGRPSLFLARLSVSGRQRD